MATMETMEDFHYERKPSHATTIQHFAVNKDEWDTKEDAGTVEPVNQD